MAAAGISSENRAFVTRLSQVLAGPFTPAEAAEATGVSHSRAARLLRHLAEQGWVRRLRRGLYISVPIDVDSPETWSADAWVVAATAFAPGYVGGWTALHYWDLTDQIFSTTAFLTTRAVPRRRREVGGERFELRHRSEAALFGTRRVWRERVPVDVSDRERTLLDCFDDPSLGGGLRHTVEALSAYAEGEQVAWERFVEYGERLGNRTVFKRLGYIAEELELAGGQLIDGCLERVSSGIGRLEPALPATGPIDRRWGLRINARIDL